jgi:hypothetical protein
MENAALKLDRTESPLHKKLNTSRAANDEFFGPSAEILEFKKHTEESRALAAPEEKNEKLDAKKEDLWKKIEKHYPMFLNNTAAGLHTLAASSLFLPFVPKSISKGLDNFTVLFSKYVLPIYFAHMGKKNIDDKKALEGLTRLAPALTLWFSKIPFFNFDFAYGLFAGPKMALVAAENHMKKTSGFTSVEENTKHVWEGLKESFKNIRRFKKDRLFFEDLLSLSGSLMMSIGTGFGMLTSFMKRDTPLAKLFGVFRNFGGILGDATLIGFKDGKHRQAGWSFVLASVLGIVQRWVLNDDVAQIFTHTKDALNTLAFTLWNMGDAEKAQMDFKTSSLSSK